MHFCRPGKLCQQVLADLIEPSRLQGYSIVSDLCLSYFSCLSSCTHFYFCFLQGPTVHVPGVISAALYFNSHCYGTQGPCSFQLLTGWEWRPCIQHHTPLSAPSAMKILSVHAIRVWLMLGAHAHESYCSQFVCLCVCYQSSTSVQHACNKLNLPA